MNPKTLASFDQLREADWFSNLGQPREGAFTIVTTWEAALQHCGSDQWQDLILEAANRYREAVFKRDPARFQKWNGVVKDVKTIVLPFIEQKVHPMVVGSGLPQSVEGAVRWDLIHFAMECEFADVYPPGFFASQAYWYTQGRFPCGWDGDFPKGKRILY